MVKWNEVVAQLQTEMNKGRLAGNGLVVEGC